MIVTSTYPRRPLVDSNVLIAAWTQRRVEPDRDVCAEFLQGAENDDCLILVATPSISELLKGTPPLELPRKKSLVPVPFDRRAAYILGKDFPASTLQALREEAGSPPSHYIKYDALIVACAKSANADCIVTLNIRHMERLAHHIGLLCRHPSAYRHPRQSNLHLLPRTGDAG